MCDFSFGGARGSMGRGTAFDRIQPRCPGNAKNKVLRKASIN